MSVSILVPFRGGDGGRRDQLWDFVERRWRWMLPGVELITGDDGGQPFSRGASLNLARSKASGTTLIIADADVLIDRRDLLNGLDVLAQGRHQWVLPSRAYVALTREHTDQIRARDDPTVWPGWPKVGQWVWISRESVSGVVLVTADAFDTVEGFDAGMVGWGGEDVVLGIKVSTLVGPAMRVGTALLHLWHPAARFDDPAWPENERIQHEYQAAAGDVEAMRALMKRRAES